MSLTNERLPFDNSCVLFGVGENEGKNEKHLFIHIRDRESLLWAVLFYFFCRLKTNAELRAVFGVTAPISSVV